MPRYIKHTASALLLALAFSHPVWSKDAVVAPAPSARQQALMATVVGSGPTRAMPAATWPPSGAHRWRWRA